MTKEPKTGKCHNRSTRKPQKQWGLGLSLWVYNVRTLEGFRTTDYDQIITDMTI